MDGVHLGINSLGVLVILLFPILENVDKFLPPGSVAVLVKSFDHVRPNMVPQIANSTSAGIGIVVGIV